MSASRIVVALLFSIGRRWCLLVARYREKCFGEFVGLLGVQDCCRLGVFGGFSSTSVLFLEYRFGKALNQNRMQSEEQKILGRRTFPLVCVSLKNGTILRSCTSLGCFEVWKLHFVISHR